MVRFVLHFECMFERQSQYLAMVIAKYYFCIVFIGQLKAIYIQLNVLLIYVRLCMATDQQNIAFILMF